MRVLVYDSCNLNAPLLCQLGLTYGGLLAQNETNNSLINVMGFGPVTHSYTGYWDLGFRPKYAFFTQKFSLEEIDVEAVLTRGRSATSV